MLFVVVQVSSDVVDQQHEVSVQMERAQKNMFDRNSEILLAITGIPER
jgi:hypothetical protein